MVCESRSINELLLPSTEHKNCISHRSTQQLAMEQETGHLAELRF